MALKQSLQASACAVFFVLSFKLKQAQIRTSNFVNLPSYFLPQDYLPAVGDPVGGGIKTKPAGWRLRGLFCFFLQAQASSNSYF
ncbi:hypothetical protein [Salinimicrobium xinjiangense]|uniref:hypothetical protein n=1 Tax=Salinimicrobium xinjiangense TaxID=438596 RepID=UPI0012EC2112|nr:hypothetical protein [Salinimicrobium xinjiangense]